MIRKGKLEYLSTKSECIDISFGRGEYESSISVHTAYFIIERVAYPGQTEIGALENNRIIGTYQSFPDRFDKMKKDVHEYFQLTL